MIGNDIVDLVLALKESHWKRKGYLDKIFTQNEQLLILNSDNPTSMIWNLWSRKEAAYKIYNRQTQVRGYFPLQIECFDLENMGGFTFGKVVVKDLVYYSKTEINAEFIHTIAVENAQYFDTIKTLENRNTIQKTNGIPDYFDVDSLSTKPVSISHHGRFERIITF
jgi:phosphopantetheinyl transferase (holo-ACP synthase)